MPVNHSGMKLGKQPARYDARTLQFSNYLKRKFYLAEGLGPPAQPLVPNRQEWSLGVTGQGMKFPMYFNDEIGDCGIAGVAHMLEVWRANNLVTPPIPSDDDVLKAYSLFGYVEGLDTTDNGVVLLDVLNRWRNEGLMGSKILAYVSVKKSELRTALDLFGGLYMGFALPLAAQHQDEWDISHGPSGAYGSWGGHCVNAVNYDERSLTCVTWGALKKMTDAFIADYMDECYAVLSEEWLGQAARSAPSGFDFAALTDDLKAVSA